jgi:hypothetical protein
MVKPRITRVLVAVGLLLLGAGGSSQAGESLSADAIIAKAAARGQKARSKETLPGYTYTKVTVTEEFDASGNIKERKEKVFEVLFNSGRTRLKLVEVNGHAPGEAELKKQAENEKHVQKMVGQSKSQSDSRDNPLTPEMVARFDFELLGEKEINGRRAYKISFKPKNVDAPVHHIVDRLLNRISGTVCIDADEFEIAQAEVFLGSEVNLLGGVVGSLKKLAYTITRTRVGDGIWFNTFSSGDFEGRKLLDSTRIKTKSQSINFRPVTS